MALADELGISCRTLYRDIAALQAQGANIEGERGLGYLLKPGFTLPPLMFTGEEIEALVLGSQWVEKRADDKLARAAGDALAKISAIIPPGLRDELYSSALPIGPACAPAERDARMEATLRRAIRSERKLALHYADARNAASERVVWPFALAYFEGARIIVAWCELRQDFRAFRVDRIRKMEVRDSRYPRKRQTLLREWKSRENIRDE